MTSTDKKHWPILALFAALIFATTATASNVLMINISGGSYDAQGAQINDTLIAAGATTTYVNLTTEGQVVDALDDGFFDQIWVFDLSVGPNDFPSDYTAIANWYNSRPENEVICDSRMISSYWNGRWNGEGMNLTENYYTNMDERGGGLLLGTDHDPYQQGINEINAQIGLEPFHGTFNLALIPVDTANPLMIYPNDMGPNLFDDSSPGQTPYGLQPNGQILYTVAWHSNNHDTPGISSTIEGEVGMHVTITAPADSSTYDATDMIDLAAEITGGSEPFTYAWSFNDGTPLGNGQTLQVEASLFPVGPSVITVLAQDSEERDDDDSIVIFINPGNMPPTCDAGGPYSGSAGEPVQFDGSGSFDTDGEIVSWTWDFGDGTTGSGMTVMHTFAEDGTYEVVLCVTDDDGLTSCCSPEIPTVPTEAINWSSLKSRFRD